MFSTNYLNFIRDTDKYCEKVSDSKQTLIVTRNNDKSFVVMDLEQYNRLMENGNVKGKDQEL